MVRSSACCVLAKIILTETGGSGVVANKQGTFIRFHRYLQEEIVVVFYDSSDLLSLSNESKRG